MTDAPLHWLKAEIRDDFLRRISEEASILILDYDGTLAPFTVNRLQAVPYPGVLPSLERLAALPAVRLVLVTGRPAHELQSLLGLSLSLEIWGSHGREQITSEGEYRIRPLAPEQVQALDRVSAALEQKGYLDRMERKPASLALHWRGLAPELREALQATIAELYNRDAAPSGLHLLPFAGGLEIRSDSVTKGDAVRRILQDMGGKSSARPGALPVAYLGDDITDEDAFRALRGCDSRILGLSFLVRQEWRESAAEFWLRPPDELLAFFEDWIAAAHLHIG